MKKALNFVKRNKKYFLIGVPVVLILLYFMFGGDEKGAEAYVVKHADVEQSVVLSGKVTTTDKADLGFAASGRVGKISVKNNQSVSSGQILAQLEIGDLLADLKIKQLNSETSTIDLEDAKREVEKVTNQENTKVASAYRNLLSEGLKLVPSSSDYDVAVPIISGLYDGPEGQYKLIIEKENATQSDLELRIFGLEKTVRIINEEGSTLLGSRGLYIAFPEDELAQYDDTIWYLNIPNKASSDYLSNLNSYNEAKDERDLAVKDAEFEYQKLLTEEGGGESGVAQAEIQKINAEIRKNTIYAPFSGAVTNIEKEVGENVSVGERVISILGKDKLEVVLQVSELDVSKLVPGAAIRVNVDAIPGEDFYGTLKTVNSRETEVEGVPVYEAFVELEPDPRIKTGMNAKGTIVLESRANVLVVPSYLIKKVGDASFVTVMNANGSVTEKPVMVGLTGTDSMVEITSGLEMGEQLVANSDEK